MFLYIYGIAFYIDTLLSIHSHKFKKHDMVTGNNPFANEIAHFSDKRILDVIYDGNNYSPALVSGCRQEAELRNLEIKSSFQIGNPFSAEVKDYSDEKIAKMLDGTVDYSPKLLDACLMEAKKRGIKFNAKVRSGSFGRDDIIQVQQSLKNGMAVENIKRYFLSKGYSDEDALTLIDKAIEMKELKPINKGKEESSGIGIFGILFLIYVIGKWVYILSK